MTIRAGGGCCDRGYLTEKLINRPALFLLLPNRRANVSAAVGRRLTAD